jgi:hypothetical protein
MFWIAARFFSASWIMLTMLRRYVCGSTCSSEISMLSSSELSGINERKHATQGLSLTGNSPTRLMTSLHFDQLERSFIFAYVS